METNRDYFSWSQYTLWKSSKMQFYKRYVLGEESPRLPQFEKGKEFADYRETGEIPFYVNDPLLKSVSSSIPVIGKSEMKIEVEFGEHKLLAYIDECKEDLTEFNEYKTGRVPWDQVQVEAHEQLDFYALCIYLKSGEKIIPKCNLWWVETEEHEHNGETILRYTGHVEKFVKKFTLKDIENIAANVLITLDEIKNYVHEELPLDEDLVKRYIKVEEELKKLKAEQDLTKLKILNELKECGAVHMSNDLGRFSISERKTPIYSTELITKENKYNEEIKKLKQKEKNDPNTKYSISESIRFTKNKK